MARNMFSQKLNQAILAKNSRVCVGLDPRLELLPRQFQQLEPAQAIFKFNQRAIDAIADQVAVIKLQSAFYELHRAAGVQAFWDTADYADVKRGDIDSTAQAYAEAYLGANSAFDAATISPFLGMDTLQPFIQSADQNDKGVFVLVKTSNPGSGDLQDLEVDGSSISQKIARELTKLTDRTDQYGYSNLGAVVGATYPGQATKLRQLMPKAILLVPGVGAQGGDISLLKNLFDPNGLGAIVSSSRGIVFSFQPDDADFQKIIAQKAEDLKNQINAVIFSR
jgi:orotidine-5'-phosphate decarboxylase